MDPLNEKLTGTKQKYSTLRRAVSSSRLLPSVVWICHWKIEETVMHPTYTSLERKMASDTSWRILVYKCGKYAEWTVCSVNKTLLIWF